MAQNKTWMISVVILVVGVTIINILLGRACGTGWLQLRVGDVQICGQPGCGPAKIEGTPREVAKLVSIEMDETASFTKTISPDFPALFDFIEFGKKLGEFGIKDEIDVTVYGTVTAGFDLDKIKASDLWTDGKRVVLQLPPPEILYTPINKIVINNHEDWCPNLICADSVEATDEIINRAKTQMIEHSTNDRKILDKTADSARKHFENFFKMMGYEDITIYIDHHPL